MKISVTNEQREAIIAFFNYNDWELDILEEHCVSSARENLESQSDLDGGQDTETTGGDTVDSCDQHDDNRNANTDNNDCNPHTSKNTSSRNGVMDADVHGAAAFNNDEGNADDGSCPYCFCSPCVTSVHQGWLGVGQAARAGNNLLRKTKYKKFWTMIARRGGWSKPAYLRKKEIYLGQKDDRIQWTSREIMPECVLKLVRSLYPNPAGIPYMGHRWG